MTMLAEEGIAIKTENLISKNDSDEGFNPLPLTYFDLLNEIPEFSEAAILLQDETIEYCYVKIGQDGSQYFGFNYCLPGSPEYTEIISRHKLENKMEANTFERYPSGKTILSKGGKILKINLPQQEKAHV